VPQPRPLHPLPVGAPGAGHSQSPLRIPPGHRPDRASAAGLSQVLHLQPSAAAEILIVLTLLPQRFHRQYALVPATPHITHVPT